MFLRQILSCYNLKNFAKLVKVLVLELFYGTRTGVHFSMLVLVLEVFCSTRTRKLVLDSITGYNFKLQLLFNTILTFTNTNIT